MSTGLIIKTKGISVTSAAGCSCSLCAHAANQVRTYQQMSTWGCRPWMVAHALGEGSQMSTARSFKLMMIRRSIPGLPGSFNG